MTDLAHAFARPDRAAGLKPPPRRDTASTTQPRTPARTTGDGTSPQTTKPPSATTTTPPAQGQAGSTTGRLLILLPVPLRDRLRTVAHSRGTTYRDLVLDAIEATVDQLPQLMAGRTTTETVNTGLFERTVSRPAPTEGKTQVTIRGLSTQNRAVLDQLVTETGASSLTELITTALDEHLPARPRSMR